MKTAMTTLAIIIGITSVLSLAAWLMVYKWEDCRKVGHTKLYCFMDLK